MVEDEQVVMVGEEAEEEEVVEEEVHHHLPVEATITTSLRIKSHRARGSHSDTFQLIYPDHLVW